MSGRDPSNRSGEVPPDQLLALLDTTADAAVVVDEVGTIRYWNRGAEAMFSHGPHEALGQSLDLIIPEHLRAEDLDRVHRDDPPPTRGAGLGGCCHP